MVYAYGIDVLGFKQSHYDVCKGNESVWRFQERLGAQRTSETELDYLYKINHEAITRARYKYLKFLPEPIMVVNI